MTHTIMWSHLLSVQPSGRIEGLDESCGVSDKQGITRGTGQHADRGQPDVGRTLRRVPTVPDTEHM